MLAQYAAKYIKTSLIIMNFDQIIYMLYTFQCPMFDKKIIYKPSVKKQKGLTTRHLHTQLDPFASTDELPIPGYLSPI